MSEEFVETIETPEEQVGLENLDELEGLLEVAASAPYRTILELWRELLRPAKAELEARVTPQWAVRIISTYPGVELEEMGFFRDRYFAKVEQLEHALVEAIASSPECLNHVTAEEDLEHNGPLYLEVLIAWQVAILRWEMAWRYYHQHAGVEIATVAEVQRMFFGESGIAALLDQIGYKFTDTQRAVMAEVLEDVRNQDEGE